MEYRCFLPRYSRRPHLWNTVREKQKPHLFPGALMAQSMQDQISRALFCIAMSTGLKIQQGIAPADGANESLPDAEDVAKALKRHGNKLLRSPISEKERSLCERSHSPQVCSGDRKTLLITSLPHAATETRKVPLAGHSWHCPIRQHRGAAVGVAVPWSSSHACLSLNP